MNIHSNRKLTVKKKKIKQNNINHISKNKLNYIESPNSAAKIYRKITNYFFKRRSYCCVKTRGGNFIKLSMVKKTKKKKTKKKTKKKKRKRKMRK